MRASWTALLLLAACSSDVKPRTRWLHEERINLKTWGAPCGPMEDESLPRPGERNIGSRRWADSVSGPPYERPLNACSLTYNSQTGQPWTLEVTMNFPRAVDRAYADELLGNLILQHLPPDVQMEARRVAYHEHGVASRKLGPFEVSGHWRSDTVPPYQRGNRLLLKVVLHDAEPR